MVGLDRKRLVLRSPTRRPCRLVAYLIVLSLVHVTAWSAEQLTGEQIYQQKCARCHGDQGQGTEQEYDEPLVGDRPQAELAALIAKTMPQDDPGACSGEEAQKVAAYIYEAFYSEAAQQRNAPPRVELSRLTVRQYRNVVADLLASFAPAAQLDERRGLRGEYYKSRRFRSSERVFERLDPEVNFDFGLASPDPEKLEHHQFSIRWEGSLLAPETGEYEFVVRTEHATRIWINDTNRPLLDAWVKSGDDTEYRASLFLIGGRSYPLRLEFSKAKQGVDDSKKRKSPPPEAKASIVLAWKLPHRAEEVIPVRHLMPVMIPPTFVVTTPFPPDDRSVGYERGTSISKAWDQATTDAAIEVAGYVAAELDSLAETRGDSSDRAEKLQQFCQRFAERAFRRPLSDTERQLYIDRQFATAPNADTAAKRVVLLVLKSPRFLYLEPHGSHDPYTIASRLAFDLWDSLPDQQLLEAASTGQLATGEQVEQQARRMADDVRARSKLREFLLGWLKVDHITDLAKDPEKYPEFNAEIASDLRTSLDLFLDEITGSPQADFRQLLLAEQLMLNGRLAKFFGVELAEDSPFEKVSLPDGPRAGVLTHPFLLAGFAYTGSSSPIHRGVFVARSMLGRRLRPPPEAVSPLAPDLHADLTTRQRVALQTNQQVCQACHQLINPLGFTLEHYDAVGRYRERENAKPIDASGSYLTQEGRLTRFGGVRDLARFLADSPETHTAVTEQLFQYLVKQPIQAFGPQELSRLRESFVKNDFNLRQLMVDIATSHATSTPSTDP